MRNYALDESGEEEIMNSDLKWKRTVQAIDGTLRKLKQETENMSQKFNLVKASQGPYQNFPVYFRNITELCDEITKYMANLVKMIPKNQETNYSSKKIELKQLSKRVELQMMAAKNLSSEVQKEIERSCRAKKLAASITSNSFGNESGRVSTTSEPGYQLSALDDPQLRQALEEQQQCEKLTKDLVQLENIMTKISELVEEQGEVVDEIHANVEIAFENTEVGVKHLEQAVESKTAVTRKKLCIIGIVIIVLAVIGMIVGIVIASK